MRKVGLYTEWGICMGCNACQIACKDAHDLPLGVNLLKVRCRETRENGQITVCFQPEACRQCRNAPCVRACLAGALFFRADGTVGYQRELCSGCGRCGNACPFGQIYPARPQPGIYRCDGCYERRQRGEEPVCVLACPVNCLRFAARDQREEVCP